MGRKAKITRRKVAPGGRETLSFTIIRPDISDADIEALIAAWQAEAETMAHRGKQITKPSQEKPGG